MPALRRRMVAAKIRFISLCPAGANMLPVVYKEEDAFELCLLTKEEMGEQGEVLACVYAPELVDAHGDAASQEIVKEAAYGFLQSGGEIDIRHDDKPVARKDAYVAESFLIQKGDERFASMKDTNGNPVDVTGGWGVVLKIENEELRSLYRSGAWRGVSMGGRGRYEDVSIYAPTRKTTNPPPQESTTMDEKQITELVTKTVSAALTAHEAAKAQAEAEKVKKEQEAAAASAPAKPAFEGDPHNPEDVKKHLAKIEAASVDWTNPEAVQKHLAKLDATTLSPEERKIKSLEDEIKKIRGGSNVGGKGVGVGSAHSDDDEILKDLKNGALAAFEAGEIDSVEKSAPAGYLIR